MVDNQDHVCGEAAAGQGSEAQRGCVTFVVLQLPAVNLVRLTLVGDENRAIVRKTPALFPVPPGRLCACPVPFPPRKMKKGKQKNQKIKPKNKTKKVCMSDSGIPVEGLLKKRKT